MLYSTLIKRLLDQEIDPAFAQRAGFIFEYIEQYKPEFVLDIGCGRGFYSNLISKYSFVKKVIGIDLNADYVEKAKKYSGHSKKVEFNTGSVYKLPYKNGTFDVIVCSEVLEHLPDDKKAINELERVLKPGGIILATVPHESFPLLWDPLNWLLMKIFHTHINKDRWWLAGIWADHERLYTEKAFKSLLKKDFKLVSFQKFVHWCWPFSHFILYAIGKNVIERIPTKNIDRFNTGKKSFVALGLAIVFALPSKLFDKIFPTSSSVNLGICAEKAKAHP